MNLQEEDSPKVLPVDSSSTQVVLNSPDKVLSDDKNLGDDVMPKDEHSEEERVSDSEEEEYIYDRRRLQEEDVLTEWDEIDREVFNLCFSSAIGPLARKLASSPALVDSARELLVSLNEDDEDIEKAFLNFSLNKQFDKELMDFLEFPEVSCMIESVAARRRSEKWISFPKRDFDILKIDIGGVDMMRKVITMSLLQLFDTPSSLIWYRKKREELNCGMHLRQWPVVKEEDAPKVLPVDSSSTQLIDYKRALLKDLEERGSTSPELPDKVLSDDRNLGDDVMPKDEHSEEEGVPDSEEEEYIYDRRRLQHILTKFPRGCRLRLLEHILGLEEKEFTRKVQHFLDKGLSDIDDSMSKDESESYPEEETEEERLIYHELIEEVLDLLRINHHSAIHTLLNEYSKIPEEHRMRVYKGLKEIVLSLSKVLNSPDEVFGDDVMPKDEGEVSDFLTLLDVFYNIPTEGENDSTEEEDSDWENNHPEFKTLLCKLTELPKEHCMTVLYNLLLLEDRGSKRQILNPPDELLSDDMHLPKGEHSEAGEAFLTFLRELTELPEEHLKRLLNYLSMVRESTSNVLNSQDEQLSDNKPCFADWNPEEDEFIDFDPEDEPPSVRKMLSRSVRHSRYDPNVTRLSRDFANYPAIVDGARELLRSLKEDDGDTVQAIEKFWRNEDFLQQLKNAYSEDYEVRGMIDICVKMHREENLKERMSWLKEDINLFKIDLKKDDFDVMRKALIISITYWMDYNNLYTIVDLSKLEIVEPPECPSFTYTSKTKTDTTALMACLKRKIDEKQLAVAFEMIKASQLRAGKRFPEDVPVFWDLCYDPHSNTVPMIIGSLISRK